MGTNDSCIIDDWSTLWLGQAVIPTGTHVKWIDLESGSKYWEVALGRYKVGQYTFTPKYAKTVIMDTGRSITAINPTDMTNLIGVLVKYTPYCYYLKDNASYLCDCEPGTFTTDFPDISFTLGIY